MTPDATCADSAQDDHVRFFSPKTHQQLAYTDDRLFLEGPGGERYRIIEGIPELLLEAGRQEAKIHHQDYYRMRAAEYDQGSDVMFRMLLCEEDTVRRQMISMLRLTPEPAFWKSVVELAGIPFSP